ncbi:hypothetical protein Scep_025352 [Stephania cephalantha]|uniref:Uncharacterized protein n=1 Tax=Stephania cephalantha TaxID=152367 RepID=A0AAP0HM89_9MAGN
MGRAHGMARPLHCCAERFVKAGMGMGMPKADKKFIFMVFVGNGIKMEFAHLGCICFATELVEDVKMASMVDDINAYSFMYPVELPSKKFAFKWVESEKTERYSSPHHYLIDGEPYWYYEYLVRKSPTSSAQESNIYGHYVAATAERDGYLYSLNASTLSKKWNLASRDARVESCIAAPHYPIKDQRLEWPFWFYVTLGLVALESCTCTDVRLVTLAPDAMFGWFLRQTIMYLLTRTLGDYGDFNFVSRFS